LLLLFARRKKEAVLDAVPAMGVVTVAKAARAKIIKTGRSF
jgi:hypothetical protein